MIGAEPYRSGRRVMRPERRLLSCAGAGDAKISGPIKGPEIVDIGDMMVSMSKSSSRLRVEVEQRTE